MRIVVTGTRGIPNILGGVETHCQALYPRIVKLGHEVILVRRKPYLNKNSVSGVYKGVRLKDIWTPKNKSFEAIIHTFLAVIYARKVKADIIHIHSIGPSIMAPFARIMGLKVVMTHHGPDYERKKWGRIAKFILKIGESFGVRYSNTVIVISKTIENIVQKKNPKANVLLIFNGVEINELPEDRNGVLQYYGLTPKDYLVAVGRFVPEKGFHDLIDAYVSSGTKKKMILIGDADHESSYSIRLKLMAKNSGVILTGFKTGDELKVLFGNASLFILPSYHEGLPISLLEAMSYNLDILASDIIANKLKGLYNDDFFKVGDVKDLSKKMKDKVDRQILRDFRKEISDNYNWERIAEETALIYSRLLK